MSHPKRQQVVPNENDLGHWRLALWLVFLGGFLFFWPGCLDRYLAPRFFFLSGALLVAIFLIKKDLRSLSTGNLHWFDFLLLGWYGLNVASVSWAFSWSEAVFYTQKTVLLLGVYAFLRLALLRDEGMVRQVLGQITRLVTVLVSAILLVQLGLAFAKSGLDNETLYDYASGLFGNKSLAAEFLFCLLVLNLLFLSPLSTQKRGLFGFAWALLVLLILVLQVRTAWVALFAGAVVYSLIRAFLEPDFRKIFLQKILPAGALSVGGFIAILSWKGTEHGFAERLNPLNYQESATSNERRFVWYKTDLLNADHYWLGVGNGSWKFWMPSKSIKGGYRLEEKNVVFTRVHNDYLEIRSEMGMVGVSWFCLLLGAAFLSGFWALKRNPDESNSGQASNHEFLTLIAGLAGYSIIQYFDFPRERIEFQVVLALFFAFLVHGARNIGIAFSWKNSGSLKTPFLVFLGLSLLFNLIIGWERMRGETHNVRLMDAQAKGNWKTVITESKLAENHFYEYTDAAIPIAWHEGVAWFQLGQFDKASTAFERAYHLNPWSFQVLNNYASALVKTNRFADAIPLFEQALNINPRYDDGKFNLSFVYFQLADYPKAEAWLNQVDTIANPGNDADRSKNKATLKRLEEFRTALREKQK